MIVRKSHCIIKTSNDEIFNREEWSDGSVFYYDRSCFKVKESLCKLLEEEYQKDIILDHEKKQKTT